MKISTVISLLVGWALCPAQGHAAVQTSLSYDYLGRVIQVTEQGQTEDYFYSGEKRVFKKEASGKKRLYLFEDHSVVFDREVEFGKRGDADGTGTWTITDAVYLINYIFAGGSSPKPNLLAGDADGNSIITIGDAVWLINFIFAGGPAPSSATLSLSGAANVFAPGAGRLWSDGAMGNEELYFVEDAVSSTSAVLAGSALGEVIHSTPFGEQLTTSNLEKRYLFTGKELDATTGLTYFGARYYDPALGRFLQWDSVMDGHNRYLYVRNNPINANDPSGHQEMSRFISQCWNSEEFRLQVRGELEAVYGKSNLISDLSGRASHSMQSYGNPSDAFRPLETLYNRTNALKAEESTLKLEEGALLDLKLKRMGASGKLERVAWDFQILEQQKSVERAALDVKSSKQAIAEVFETFGGIYPSARAKAFALRNGVSLSEIAEFGSVFKSTLGSLSLTSTVLGTVADVLEAKATGTNFLNLQLARAEGGSISNLGEETLMSMGYRPTRYDPMGNAIWALPKVDKANESYQLNYQSAPQSGSAAYRQY